MHAWVLVCVVVATTAGRASAGAVRLHPCDGVGAFAKEFQVEIGTRITGVRFAAENPQGRLPEILLVPGPVSQQRAPIRTGGIREAMVPGVVSAIWAGEVHVVEPVYHVILRMPSEEDAMRVARIGTLGAGVPNGSYVVGGSETPPIALGADLDIELVVSRMEKAQTGRGPLQGGATNARPHLHIDQNSLGRNLTLILELPSVSFVSGSLHDVRGRVVRELIAGVVLGAGTHRIDWDGRASDGRRIASGVYFAHVVAGTNHVTCRIVMP